MPPCGGGAEVESVEQEAELAPRLLLADRPIDVEDPLLHVARGGYGSSRRRSRCRCRRGRRRTPAAAPGSLVEGVAALRLGAVNGWCTGARPALGRSPRSGSNIGASTTQRNDQPTRRRSARARGRSRSRAAPSSASVARALARGEEDASPGSRRRALQARPVRRRKGSWRPGRRARRPRRPARRRGPARRARLAHSCQASSSLAGLRGAARHHTAPTCRSLEDAERGVREVAGQVDQLDGRSAGRACRSRSRRIASA